MKIKSKFSGKEYSLNDTFDESFVDNTTTVSIKADLTKDMMESLIAMGYAESVDTKEEKKEGNSILKYVLESLAAYYNIDVKTLVKYLKHTAKIADIAVKQLLAKTLSNAIEDFHASKNELEKLKTLNIRYGINLMDMSIMSMGSSEFSEEGMDKLAYFYTAEDAKMVSDALKAWDNFESED